jgi:hypothetical protein
MDRRRPSAALAVACAALTGCLVLTGCGAPAPAPGKAAPPQSTGPTAGPTAESGLGDSVRDSGAVPDPCTLFSARQVTGLTGREVTRIDEDGAEPGASTRFCQWQQSGGQVTLFLSRTTEADFTTTIADAKPVDGVGEDAFQLAGHLYVLYGTVSIDVYSRGDSEAENLAEAKAIVRKVIPQI